MSVLTFLHTNDLHGRLNDALADKLCIWREGVDLYFDSGDGVQTGNLGVPRGDDPLWGLLAKCRCTASVMGNRESHVLEPLWKAKLSGHSHPVLCANMRRKDGSYPLPRWLTLQVRELTIGIVGVMVPMVTERMGAKALSAFLWDPPLEVAGELGRQLRPQVDVLIGLTHIGHTQDLELAKKHPEFDIILGGHSHTELDVPVRVGNTWIAQGGSHARYVGSYRWEAATRSLTGGLFELGRGLT